MNADERKDKIERYLLENQYPFECSEIPLEELSEDERNVVIKCMEHIELTDEEFKLLKATLQRYREAINKYKPSETLDAVEKVEQMIVTEEEWLNIVNDESIRRLKVNVPFNEKWYPMEFEILPLDDSRVFNTLQTHLDLFNDYSKDEVKIWNKAQAGHAISPEEQKIADKITMEINEKQSENRIESINTFLAAQLRLPESNSDMDVRKEFWEKFPFITKAAIMTKVEDKLGLSEQSDEKLFPTS